MRKNLFVAFIFVLVASFVSAQSIQPQVTRVGFFGGPVAGNMWEKVGGMSRMHDYVLGATLGIMLDVPMQKIGSFQPGIDYIGKNSKDSYTDNNGQPVNTKTTLSYLEVPLNVVFRIRHGDGNFTLGGGVAAAVALAGKQSTTAGTSLNDKEDLKFGDLTTDNYGRYDFGINGLAGYEFKNGFFIHLNYNWGINRLFVGGDPKDKLYNNYLALKAGFLFGGKAKKQ
jgi:hypothetical protein